MNDFIEIEITGKNINNILKWIISNKISIKKTKMINPNKIILIIKKQDLNKIKKYSKTYNITIKKYYGLQKYKYIIKKYRLYLILSIISVIEIYVLSNIIFSISIQTNNNELKTIILKELNNNNIKKYHFKLNDKELEKVKNKIINNNKTQIEWLDIEENGTKYNIRLVERKINNNKEDVKYQSIVASKNAILKEIKAITGEKVKYKNQYVKSGETIISGIITKPNNENVYVKATGKIYGEIWYKINVDYPLYYQEEYLTGNNKKVLTINFLNKKHPLFNYKKYKQFKSTNNIYLENKVIPLNICKETIYEVKTKEKIYTEEEAISNSIKLSTEKLKQKNDKIISIDKVDILSKQINNKLLNLSLLVTATEDITKIVIIETSKID